jgi:hypothetical protein
VHSGQHSEQVWSAIASLAPCCVDEFGKIRVGAKHDGGYVMLDDLGGIAKAISLGIGDEDSWDIGIASRGIAVLQFDHTIKAPPTANALCTFFPKRVVTNCARTESEITFHEVVSNVAGDLILKMDIEGDEWTILKDADSCTLSRFRQIICEFHGLQRILDSQQRRLVQATLTNIARTHAVVHLHGNNYLPLHPVESTGVPIVLEVTFARRNQYRLHASTESFPSPLDSPNYPHRDDLPLADFISRIVRLPI